MSKLITLKKNEDHRITEGHLWAFSNEIASVDGVPESGDIVQLRNHVGKFLGLGIYNPHSLIAVRLLTRIEEEIDFDFFRKRIGTALSLRRKLYPSSETFRLVHGEADLLPGLVIDKYNDYLSVQTFSAGMDRRLTLICDVLESILKPAGIIERNDAPIRALEGLPQREGVIRGQIESTVIAEHEIKYAVDIVGGQKTGFFLDQRENRKAIRRYAKGARVLDCFCNEGGFALNAAYAEAERVVGVDISAESIARATENARMNRMEATTSFIAADAFEYLKKSASSKEAFDLVNLDPPSFAKNKKSIVAAKYGYREIHQSAIALLPPGGILATSCCSHHITEETFLEVIDKSARSVGRSLMLLEWRGPAPDHPVLPAMPETRYLKFGIFQLL